MNALPTHTNTGDTGPSLERHSQINVTFVSSSEQASRFNLVEEGVRWAYYMCLIVGYTEGVVRTQ
jgi:hypothetical protein